jgi:hypothetical protein
MGMGSCEPPLTAAQWNSGSCDVMAVALHRLYGLPLMAEFEYGTEGGERVPGYLVHAFVHLPDGRALDAAGPREMFVPAQGSDPDDPWVEGYGIVGIADDDPHLLDVREEDDYVESIRRTQAFEWIEAHLAPTLAGLGLLPVRTAEDEGQAPPSPGF